MILPQVYKTLKGFLAENHINNKVCAREVGCNALHLGRVLNGKVAVSSSLAQSFADVYGFNYDWLMTGEGNVFSCDETAEIVPKSEILTLRQRIIDHIKEHPKVKSRQTSVKHQ